MMKIVLTSNQFLVTTAGGAFWALPMSASFMYFTECAVLVLRSKLGR